MMVKLKHYTGSHLKISNLASEILLLLVYLLPFTLNPIYFIQALRNLDQNTFPELRKRLSKRLTKLIDQGLDPLTALERTAQTVNNTFLYRILSTFTLAARNVGSSTFVIMSFFEKSIQSLTETWAKYSDLMKIVLEIFIILNMMTILTVIISSIDPSYSGYLYILPASLIIIGVFSLSVYLLYSPPIGNPYDTLRTSYKLSIVYYIAYIVIFALFLKTGRLEIVISSTLLGLIVEMENRKTETKYQRFLDDLSNIQNNIHAGYPGIPLLNEVLEKYRIAGRTGALLSLLKEGVIKAGETGLRKSFTYIYQVIEKGYFEFRKYKYITTAYMIIVIIISTLIVYSGLRLSETILKSWGNSLVYPVIDISLFIKIGLISAYFSPLAISLSYRPRTPPIAISSLGILFVYTITYLI